MAFRVRIDIPKEKVAAFCRRHHIRKLSFFGSVLREDFGPKSDIDVLVEFEPGHKVGLFRFADIESELSEILGGRRVDLNTEKCLSRYFRDEVIREAQIEYVEA